jgi:hypothetical protein
LIAGAQGHHEKDGGLQQGNGASRQEQALRQQKCRLANENEEKETQQFN